MAQKPSIPKGTRDFLPVEVERRSYLFETIKHVFKKYGFGPIETPSFEKSSTLMGKYGEEGDRLIFKILNSGDYLKKEEGKIELYFSYFKWIAKSLEEIRGELHLIKYGNPGLVEHQIRVYSDSDQFKNKIKLILSSNFNDNFSDNFDNQSNRKENLKIKVDFDFLYREIIVYLTKLDTDEELRMRVNNNEGHRHFIKEVLSSNSFKFEEIQTLSAKKLTPKISEKALRYDLTVPFARFVVQHQNDLTFPFKRYQIQPVWRADRPQHGRYQEFTQCDADVVGSDSLLHEVDLIFIFDEVLSTLKIPDFSIKINNRKILSGIAEISGEAEKIIDITVAIDKLDKVGEEGVIKELNEKGVSASAIEIIKPLFTLSGDNKTCLDTMETMLASSEIGMKGIEELRYVLEKVEMLGLKEAKLEFDVTLARGLNYYTGAIFEVKANGVKMGSICGGGRYDDLTGLFGMKGMSGVGISFGADRIYDVIHELNLFPENVGQTLDVMFVNFGEKEQDFCLSILKQMRENNIACEIYPSKAKMQKQMKYANDKNVPFVVIVGEKEMEDGKVQLKNMETGEQSLLTPNELAAKWAK